MPISRNSALAASALVALSLATAACSKAATPATTTTSSTAAVPTTENPFDLPATGSVDGVTLEVNSSPLTGTLGHTTMRITVVLKGDVPAAHLNYQISDVPTAAQGRPAVDTTVAVSGPGTFHLPTAFVPPRAGHWAVTVTYTPGPAKDSKLSVSGLPPVAGTSAPFPQLVTVVTG